MKSVTGAEISGCVGAGGMHCAPGKVPVVLWNPEVRHGGHQNPAVKLLLPVLH